MGFFNGDDELLWLILSTSGGKVTFGLHDVQIMDTTRQDVRHEHVTEEATLLAKLQDDMDAFVDELHDLEDRVLDHLFLQEVKFFQAFELAVQGRDGLWVRPNLVRKVFDVFRVLMQQYGEPVTAVFVHDQVR